MSNDQQFLIDREIKLHNRLDELNRLNEQLEEIGMEAGWPSRTVLDLSLACEELLVNIVNYGYPMGGEHSIAITVTASPANVEVRIEDGGVPFNPLAQANPDTSLDLEERMTGGLGIFFVKRLMDDIHYERAGNLNRFSMRKRLAAAGQQDQQQLSGGLKDEY